MAALMDSEAQAVNPVRPPPPGDALSMRQVPDGDLPPPKRRKIPLACNACRDRKTRCDGGRPTCSTCTRKGKEDKCIYDDTSLITQKYVANLEGRVKDLEKSTRLGFGLESNAATDLEMPILDVPTDHNGSVVGNRASLPGNQPGERFWTAVNSTIAPYNDVMVSDGTVSDALNTVPSYQDDSESLFGGSSFIAFVRSMVQTVSPSDTTSELSKIQLDSGRDSQSRNGLFRKAEIVSDIDLSSFTLPRRRAADNYLNCFWECVHPVFPIVHKTTFLASYQTLWLSEYESSQNMTSEDPVFLSTLNIVFAIGCQFSDITAPARRTSLADQFYQQARKLVAVDAIDSTSLAIVQMLLLTGVYLQSTRYASRCWNIVGLAIRNAQGIGLHLEHLRTDSRNQIEQETRRRTWHCCVVLDRLVALTFGRPKMIAASWNVPLPVMVDDEYLLADGQGFQPSHLESRIGLFVYSIKLFDIMDEILSTCYPQKDNRTMPQEVGARQSTGLRLDDVLRLNSMLDDFLETLPPHLSIDSLHGPENDWSIQQAKVLSCRFLYIRALLLRPILLLAVQERNGPNHNTLRDSKLEQQVAIRVCILCVETTHTLIIQLHENLHAAYRSPGWHTVHYTFACAMILIAAGLCGLPGPECSEASLQASWSRCIAMLEYHKSQITSASHAIQVLERLQQRLACPRDNAAAAEATREALGQLAGSTGTMPQEGGLNGFSVHNLSKDDMFNFDALTDSWFAQQIVDLDWLENV